MLGTGLLSNVENVLLNDTLHPQTHPHTDMEVEAYGLNIEQDTNEEINEKNTTIYFPFLITM